MKKIYVLGSDSRFDLVAEGLAADGFEVYRQGKSEEKAVYLLHPSKKEEDVLSFFLEIRKGSVLFLGRASVKLREGAKRRGLLLFALEDDADYLYRNSVATAEGTLAALIENTAGLLSETKVLVCGYGNCGKAIASLLSRAGCRILVFSRQGSMKRAKEDGFETADSLLTGLKTVDAVVNTVPTPLFDPYLYALPQGTLFLQVASGLSGIDPTEWEERGVRFLPLPGLPGRFAPRTEGEAIKKFIKDTLDNQNESG